MKNTVKDVGFLLAGLGGGALLANNQIGTAQIGWTTAGIGVVLVIGAWLSEPAKIAIAGRPIDDWEYVAFSKSFPFFPNIPKRYSLKTNEKLFGKD